jgi:hypothetical protein
VRHKCLPVRIPLSAQSCRHSDACGHFGHPMLTLSTINGPCRAHCPLRNFIHLLPAETCRNKVFLTCPPGSFPKRNQPQCCSTICQKWQRSTPSGLPACKDVNSSAGRSAMRQPMRLSVPQVHFLPTSGNRDQLPPAAVAATVLASVWGTSSPPAAWPYSAAPPAAQHQALAVASTPHAG